jgi:solute carrier family 35 protein C2
MLYIGSYAATLLTFSGACLLARRCCCRRAAGLDPERHQATRGLVPRWCRWCRWCRCALATWRYLLLTGAGFAGWFSISVSFSLFNKLVLTYMRNGAFKVPFFITSIHFLIKLVCMLLWVNIVRPVLPGVLKKLSACVSCGGRCEALECAADDGRGLERERAEAERNSDARHHSCREIWTKFVPIGIFTGLDISFTNLALEVGTVSLVTLTKGVGIFLTLSFSVCLGLQQCSKSLVGVLCVIAVGMSMSLWKEPDFNLSCVMYAATASAFGALRWTCTQSLAQHTHARVDTLILYTAPSAVFVAAVSAYQYEASDLKTIFADPESVKLLLMIAAFGGFLTLFLLAIEILMVQITSALTLDVGAKVKDISLIVLSIMLYHDQLRPVNALGFFVASAGLVGYGVLKRNVPDGLQQANVRRTYHKVGMRDDDMDDLWSAEIGSIEDEEFGLGDIELQSGAGGLTAASSVTKTQ